MDVFVCIVIFRSLHNKSFLVSADEDDEPRCVSLTPRHKAAIRFIRKVRIQTIHLNQMAILYTHLYIYLTCLGILQWKSTSQMNILDVKYNFRGACYLSV